MADVVKATNEAGDVSIGIEEDGVFVPFATVPAHRIAHRVERGKQLAERVEGGDEEAQKAVDADFVVGGPKKSNSSTKGGES